MRKQLFFLFFFAFATQVLQGQDTLHVNFKFGSSRIVKAEKEKLKSYLEKADVFQLDSIQFIGMTDSIGSFEANLLLSQKRANQVLHYTRDYFPENVKKKTLALGERHENQESRQVLLVLHYLKSFSIDSSKTELEEKVDGDCIYIDYTLLNTSHIRTVKKGRKEYIYIESNAPSNFFPVPDYFRYINYGNHYYGDTNSKGKFVIKKIKWRKKRTGAEWWMNSRLTAFIPKSSFDKFKIFSLDSLPCNYCSLRSEGEWRQPLLKGMWHIDNFVSNNIQFKRKFLSKKRVKLRAPREYIDTNISYYSAKSGSAKVEWYEKRRKKNQKYLFSNVKFNHKSDYAIYRTFKYCENPIVDTSSLGSFRIMCAGLFRRRDTNCIQKSRTLLLELGSNYDGQELSPYVGLKFNLNKLNRRLNNSLFLGGNTDLHPFLQFRSRYEIYNVSLGSGTKSFDTWSRPYLEKKNYWRGVLYGGFEASTKYRSNEFNFDTNVNLGVAFKNWERNKRFTGLYLQYNYPLNFIENQSEMNSRSFRIGLNFRLLKDKLD